MFRSSLFTILVTLGLSACATTAPPHPQHAEHVRQARLDAAAERQSAEDAELAQVEREVLVRQEIEAICQQDGAACETLRKREVLRICAHASAACNIPELMLGPSAAPVANETQNDENIVSRAEDDGAVGAVATMD